MKKILFFLFLLFPTLSIKADTLDCGYYLSNINDSNNKWYFKVKVENSKISIIYYEKNGSKVINNDVNGMSAVCPEKIYAFCSGGTCEQYSYSLTESWFSATVEYFVKAPDDQQNPESHIIKPGDKYDNVEKCKDTTYEFIAGCGCMPSSLTDLTSRLYFLLKIIAPALLLIVGGFDMIKAVTAQDEKAIQKAQQKLVNKFVAAAAIFLTFTVVQLLVSLLSKDAEGTLVCLKYILEGYNG